MGDGTGGRRRLLVGFGSGAPRLVADLTPMPEVLTLAQETLGPRPVPTVVEAEETPPPPRRRRSGPAPAPPESRTLAASERCPVRRRVGAASRLCGLQVYAAVVIARPCLRSLRNRVVVRSKETDLFEWIRYQFATITTRNHFGLPGVLGSAWSPKYGFWTSSRKTRSAL